MTRNWSVALALLGLAACAGGTETPPAIPRTAAVTSASAWSGAEVMVVSPSFTGVDSLPVVTVEGAMAQTRRVSAGTVAVRLPSLPGTYRISVHFHAGDTTLAGTVTTAGGFNGILQGPPNDATMFAWPDPNGATVLDYKSTLLNLSSGATSSLPVADSLADATCLLQGPGPAAGGGVVVGGAPNCLWRVAMPDGSIADSMPSSGDQYAVYFGPGRWLGWANGPGWFSRTSQSFQPIVQWGAPPVVVSAGTDWAVPLHGVGSGGIPVFNTHTMSVAYTIPGINDAGGAFSPQGDTLFLFTRDPTTLYRLLVLRASDGSVLAADSTTVYASEPFMALDPSRPWLYVWGSAGPPSAPVVTVIDRRSMQVVTQLLIPAASWVAPPPNTHTYTLFVDATARRLYLHEEYQSGRILVYDLLP
ncbi:MAG TPA: hypothetical protein VGI92_03525 [Gemmatimonadales bacterium]|jgi:hypothetical protein